MKTKLWLFAAGCLLLAGYLAWDFYTTTWQTYQIEINQLNQDIEMDKKQLTKIMAQNQRKEELEFEIEQSTEYFKELKEMFPDKESVPGRLQDLTSASRRAGVNPIYFKPLLSEEKDFYNMNFYEIRLTSGYHELGVFLQNISNFKYPTGISSVSIATKVQGEKEGESESRSISTEYIQTTLKFNTFTSKNE